MDEEIVHQNLYKLDVREQYCTVNEWLTRSHNARGTWR